MDSSGNAYVAGNTQSFGAGGTDACLVKFNDTGVEWNYTWGGSGDEYGYGVALDSSGNAYVTGKTESFGAGGYDACLVKFAIDTAAPTSDSPSDFSTDRIGTESVTWTLIDDWGGGFYKVIANNTIGNYYTWVDWTPWVSGSQLNVQVNRTAHGIFNYTVLYNDSHGQLGTPDSVLVNVTNGGSQGGGEIPGYDVVFLLGVLFVISAFTVRKQRKMKNKTLYTLNK